MQKKKQGISLIVLVITIIVMIVLAAAVIISLNNNGIINRASNAVKSYNEDEVNHMASLAWSEAYLNPDITTDEEYAQAVNTALTNQGVDISKYLITVTTSGVTVLDKTKVWIQDGLNITKGNVTLEAGDLIQYNAGVQGYSGAWKVLGAEDGNLLIMATTNVTTLGLYGLRGGVKTTTTFDYGVLNGIARLNEISEPYGNGTGAVGARSIKIEDVDKLTKYDKTTFGANQINHYGNQVTFSWNSTTSGNVDYSYGSTSGTLSTSHSNGFTYVDFNTMQETTIASNATGMPTLTIDYYSYSASSTTLPTRSSKASEMIFGSGISAPFYWLASPYIDMSTTYVTFALRCIGVGAVVGSGLFASSGNEYDRTYGVRPVVKLSPSITIGTKDNTLGWSYTV